MGNIPGGWYLAAILILIGAVALVLKRSGRKSRDEYIAAKAAYDALDERQKRYENAPSVPAGAVVPFGAIAVGTLVLAAIAFLSSFVYQVPARNVAIVTQFGKVQETTLNNGIHIGSPFLKLNNWTLTYQDSTMTGVPGCDANKAPDCKGGDEPGGDAVEVRGSDNGQLWVDVTIRYSVDEQTAAKLYRSYLSLDHVKAKLVRPTVKSILVDIYSNVVSTDAVSKDRAEIEAQATERVTATLKPFGIDVQSVQLRGVNPSADVDKFITAKLQATQNAQQALITQQQQVTEAETRKQVAERDAAAARTKAQGEADATKTKADAEAYANEKVAQSVTEELTKYLMAQNIGKAGSVIYLPANFGGLLNLAPPTTTGK